MTPDQAALALRSDLRLVASRSVALVWRQWDRVDAAAIGASWEVLLPDATAVMVAAQTVSAELTQPYLAASRGTDRPPAAAIAADGFAGWADGDQTVEQLLRQAGTKAEALAATGVRPAAAVGQLRSTVGMYAATTAVDAGRLGTSAAMAARTEVGGYYRMLVGKTCNRCAVLAGKFFAVNEGFKRHPRCDCVHRPARQAGDGSAFNARTAIARGDVTGLSKAQERAILEFGADPAQVINASQGMYVAGGRKFTTIGTSRAGLAGQRMAQLDKATVARYAQQLRPGTTFGSGKAGGYRYGQIGIPRPTPEAILAAIPDRAKALTAMKDFGYLV